MMEWFEDWQSTEHARIFDYRAAMDRRNLIRDYESYNDVRLLSERIGPERPLDLLEVGCATGEFYRYLRFKHPRVRYCGVDISRPAIARAKAKYAEARFWLTEIGLPLSDALRAVGAPATFEVVYTKDVVHHQLRPYELLTELLYLTSEMLVFRCRTRDVGATEMDPERSCQYHYDGWMPYIVMNLAEVIEHIRKNVPEAEVVVYRNHAVLGGQNGRFLPRECYLPGTGTAETAIAVVRRTAKAGQVTVSDRREMEPSYTLDFRARHLIRRAMMAITARRQGSR